MYARNLPQRFLFNVAMLGQAQLQRIINYYDPPDPETEIGHADHSLAERWVNRCLLFLDCAELISTIDSEPITLSSHRMVDNGILLLPAWKVYKHVLSEAGFLEVIPFVGTDYAVRYHAIGDLHSGTNAGWGGGAVHWNRHTVRHALRHGYFELSPYPLPTSEPPEISIARGTVTQWTQYARLKQQEQMQRAVLYQRVNVPVLSEITLEHSTGIA